MRESSNGLVKHMYSQQGNGKPASNKSAGKLTFDSVGSKFRSQLVVLLEKLKSTVSDLLCDHAIPLLLHVNMYKHCLQLLVRLIKVPVLGRNFSPYCRVLLRNY